LTNSLTGQFGFSYDTLSRRTALTRPNGVNTTYGYDSLSRLLNVLHQNGTNTLDGAGYAYDNAGNRTAKTNYLNNITEQYTYDPTYQLTQVTQGATTTPRAIHMTRSGIGFRHSACLHTFTTRPIS
jgi:YD repeat-containing protein